jgi:group I intron endonuclease
MNNYYGIIYCAINKINGKIYIGQTIKTLQKRINNHKYDAKISKNYFHRSLQKYGIENFSWGIIDYAYTKKDLDDKEKWWISYYDTIQKGYNILKGGQIRLTPEIYKKIGESNIGRKHSEETKKKISKGNKGKIISEEHRNKISKKMKERCITKKFREKMSILMKLRMKGVLKSEEQKRKMSIAHIGMTYSEETKKKISNALKNREYKYKGKDNKKSLSVLCIDTNIVYGSTREAERETGVDHSQIIKCCKGKYSTAGKFHWQYAGETT